MTQKESATLKRQELMEKMDPNAICVINSNDVFPSNSDGTIPYKPNADIVYLSGIQQEDTAIILFPNHPDPKMREVLFIKYVNENFVKWHGKRLSLEEAAAASGIETIYWDYELTQIFQSAANYADKIYLNTIEHPRSENMTQTRDHRFIQWCQSRFPLHIYKRLTPLLAELRYTKNEFEISQLQKACDITRAGFLRVAKYLKPGVREKQLIAEMIHEYLQHDGNWADYQPIAASGANSCILHYISNHNTCKDGDIILIDAAASYNLYNADLTRCLPVNGQFSPRQKEVYQSVLNVHNQMKQYVKAGITFQELLSFSHEHLGEELIKLKLCSSQELKEKGLQHYIQKYCYHEYSHTLGLDVHDVGHKYNPLPENAVITIEPGIYIQDENIGVRLENNVRLTKTGMVDLMKDIPIEVEEIEKLMSSN